MRIKTITVGHLRPFESLREDEAENYYRAGQYVDFLNRVIVSPFKNALKKGTRYSDNRIPNEVVEKIYLKESSYPIRVKIIPTEKTPSMEEVYRYLKFIIDDMERTHLMSRRSKQDLYIPVFTLIAKIEEKREEVTKHGVKCEIAFPDISEDELGPIEDGIVINLDGGFSRITRNNLLAYSRASRKEEYFTESIVKPFERQIKASTGWSKERIPKETIEDYEQIGKHVFRILSVPADTLNYNSIIKALFGQKTKTGKIGKNTGDLVRIEEGVEDERTTEYEVETGAKRFVSLKSLKRRLEQLEEQMKGRVLTQKIEHYPLV